MSKTEILRELPQLGREGWREILERICELEEDNLLQGGGPTAAERALLDREWTDYQANPNAGSPWPEVEARLRRPVQ